MNRDEKLHLIRDTGVIAIMRAQSSGQLMAAADAIRQGGVRVDRGDDDDAGRARCDRGGHPALWR